MREIKFRAFDKKDKIMWMPLTMDELIQGRWEMETEDQSSSLPHNDYLQFAHSDTIWMQFTGLKDKNGKEIYEGDRFKWADLEGVVVFERGCFVFRTDRLSMNCRDHESVEFKVIGNIYENPELLTK